MYKNVYSYIVCHFLVNKTGEGELKKKIWKKWHEGRMAQKMLYHEWNTFWMVPF